MRVTIVVTVRDRYSATLRSRPLSQNEARNIALRLVQTPYVVFLDNDVAVEPGWLEALVGCADETGADIVGPLVLWGEPDDGVVETDEARGLTTLVADSRPWSYSGLLPIDPDDAFHGEVILKVTVAVSAGRLGVGVRVKNTSSEFLGPEQSIDVGGGVELRFRLPDVREAGYLVFRGWTPGPTRAWIAEIALHAAAGDGPQAP